MGRQRMYAICWIITTVLILVNILIFVAVTQRRSGDGYVRVEDSFTRETPSLASLYSQAAETYTRGTGTNRLSLDKTHAAKRVFVFPAVTVETVGTASPNKTSSMAPQKVSLLNKDSVSKGASYSSHDKFESRKRTLSGAPNKIPKQRQITKQSGAKKAPFEKSTESLTKETFHCA